MRGSCLVLAACVVLGGCSVIEQPGGGPPILHTELAGIGPRDYFVTTNSITPVPPPPPGNIPASGSYRGIATRLNDPGGDCVPAFPVFNWHVRGDHVDFGAYRGRVRPDGGLTMQVGLSYVYGVFHGNRFEGEFWRPGPACDYRITMQPVA